MERCNVTESSLESQKRQGSIKKFLVLPETTSKRSYHHTSREFLRVIGSEVRQKRAGTLRDFESFSFLLLRHRVARVTFLTRLM